MVLTDSDEERGLVVRSDCLDPPGKVVAWVVLVDTTVTVEEAGRVRGANDRSSICRGVPSGQTFSICEARANELGWRSVLCKGKVRGAR